MSPDTMQARFRYCFEEGNYGDKVLGESHVSSFGPAKLPAPTHGGPIHALDCRQRSDYASRKWNKKAVLVYVASAALDVSLSNTKGFYVRVHRWLFLYRDHKNRYLLVLVASGPTVTHMIAWSDEQNRSHRFEKIVGWKTDATDALRIILQDNVIPSLSMIVLRMNSIGGLYLPTWILPFNSYYMVSAKNNSIVYDTRKVAQNEGYLRDVDNREGKTVPVMRQRIEVNREYLERVLRRNISAECEYTIEKDFANGFVISHIFRNWKVLFYYDSAVAAFYGHPTRATAYANDGGTVLARAAVLSAEQERFQIKEVHYDGLGEVTYEGRLVVPFHAGWAIETTPISGTKNNEYFFFWPSSRLV